jgi:hypothetical protein
MNPQPQMINELRRIFSVFLWWSWRLTILPQHRISWKLPTINNFLRTLRLEWTKRKQVWALISTSSSRVKQASPPPTARASMNGVVCIQNSIQRALAGTFVSVSDTKWSLRKPFTGSLFRVWGLLSWYVRTCHFIFIFLNAKWRHAWFH